MTEEVRWYGVLTDEERAGLVTEILNRASRGTLNWADWWNLLQSHARDDTMQIIAALGDILDPINLNSLLVNWWTCNAQA